MKRVAIIGADFSPSSLPPATRIRFFAKHLPEFGWEPIIITTNPEHYETAIDSESEQLLPGNLRVIRTEAFAAGWTRKFGIGDIGMRSMWQHWQALKKLLKEQRIDLLLISVPPYATMTLGRLANKKFGLPYVIDYIDPWVTEYYWQLPKERRPPKWPLAYLLSRTLEPFALKRVSSIVGVSRGTTDSVVERYKWLSEGLEIPYGVEVGDFDYAREHPRENKIFDSKDGLLHVTYVGTYAETMRPTLEALFEGLRRGLENNPIFERVRLHFVGTTYSTNGSDPYRVTAVARSFGVEEYVDERPLRIPYLDSLQLMMDSHALILLGSVEPHYTASKVFACILARRPLLAIFHEDSSVVSILREVSGEEAITFNSEKGPAERRDDICNRFERIVEGSANNESSINWDALAVYSTNAMTKRLAHALDLALDSAKSS
jgi:hypothetical protein